MLLFTQILQSMNFFISTLEKQLKASQNDVAKCCLKCCKCFLWCLEKFVKFLNRNIYIMCAMKGTNFCRSGKDAFNLLMRNSAKVMVLNSTTTFLLFIGKVVIMAIVGK